VHLTVHLRQIVNWTQGGEIVMLHAIGLNIATALLAALVSVGSVEDSIPGPLRKFSAFSWTHMSHIPEARGRWSRRDLTDMVVIAPWTSLDDAAARLVALPAGKRWIMLFIITDSMANNPRDYCTRLEYRIETKYVPAAPVLSTKSASGRAASRQQLAMARLQASSPLVPVQYRTSSTVLTSTRGVWMDIGIADTRQKVKGIMDGLKARGVVLDGVIVDNETTLHVSHYIQTPGSFAAIQADPRWPALATSLGLPTKFTDINWGSDLYFKWTQVMAGRFDQALNAAVFAPIRSAFPNAVCSNYCSGAIAPGKAWPDVHGHLDLRTTAGFGTHDSEEFYGWTTSNRTSKVTGSLPASAAWRAFRLELVKIRAMRASSSRPKHAWIGAKSWAGEDWGKVSLFGSGLWEEMVLQLGISGVNTYLLYSPYLPGQSKEVTGQRISIVDSDQDRLQNVLAELNEFAGDCSDVCALSPMPSWNDSVLVSGRVSPRGIVWRISFAEEVQSAEVRFSDGEVVVVRPDVGKFGTWLTRAVSKRIITVIPAPVGPTTTLSSTTTSGSTGPS
jgi:hypothetical protein